MLKSVMVSKAAKLIAACVCPAVLTLTVPPIRDAVHKATAPRAAAQAKPRVRRDRQQRAAPAPAQTAAVALACPQYTGIGGLPELAATPLPVNARPFDLAPPSTPGLVAADIGAPPSALTQPAPGIPEPETWATLVIGFMGMGMALRHPRAADARTPTQ